MSRATPVLPHLFLPSLVAVCALGCDTTAPALDAPTTNDVAPTSDVPRDGGVLEPRDVPAIDGGPLVTDPCVADDTCPPGVWVNVTPAGMDLGDYGAGPVVVDPLRPSDLYLGGGGNGVWRSTDYGNHWTQINDTIPYVPMGLVIAVAGTSPSATLWVAAQDGGRCFLHRSTDGGTTWDELDVPFADALYSIVVDPNDDTHLISGLHEADGIVESTDGGVTWTRVGTSGFPSGGVSWYPFFIDTGDATTSRQTWLAIAQGGGGLTITHDGGATWSVPAGMEGLEHAHGNAQIFQRGAELWVPGIYGPGGGLYHSEDRGTTFTRALDGNFSIAWGTERNVYVGWGWACGDGCDGPATILVAPLPDATDFTPVDVDPAVRLAPSHVVVTSDGTHDVFVGMAWADGIWRYVEP